MNNRYHLSLILFSILTFFAGSFGMAEPVEAGDDESKKVTITANKLNYKPDTIDVEAGEPITVVMKNEGFVSHSFDILKNGKTETSSKDEDYIHRTHSVQPDSFIRTTFEIDDPGEYTFVCDVATHVKAGMKGSLKVREE